MTARHVVTLELSCGHRTASTDLRGRHVGTYRVCGQCPRVPWCGGGTTLQSSQVVAVLPMCDAENHAHVPDCRGPVAVCVLPEGHRGWHAALGGQWKADDRACELREAV